MRWNKAYGIGLACWCLLSVPAFVAPAFAFQEGEILVRRDVAVDRSMLPTAQGYLKQLFQGRIYANPAKQNSVLIQVGQETVSVQFLESQNSVRIEGPRGLATDIAVLTSEISKSNRESSVRVVPLNDNGQASWAMFSQRAEASRLKNGANGVGAPIGSGPSITNFLQPRGTRQTQARNGPNDFDRDGQIRLASGMRNQAELLTGSGPSGAAQPPALQPNSNAAAANPAGGLDENAKSEPPSMLPLPQFEGVQIEMLPELDAVILRGRDQQLTDLSEIIKRLDETSRLTRPEIEVIQLQHVNSSAISELIETTQEKLVGTRQGRVTVTPLGTPNSLLLIGWGESMVAMKELIQKLDQPSNIDSSFAVIPLQHAIASEIQTQWFRNQLHDR